MSSKAIISGLVSGTVTFLLFYKLFSMVPEEAPLTFTGLPHAKYPEAMNFSSIVNTVMIVILALFILMSLFLVLIDQLKYLSIEEEMQK